MAGIPGAQKGPVPPPLVWGYGNPPAESENRARPTGPGRREQRPRPMVPRRPRGGPGPQRKGGRNPMGGLGSPGRRGQPQQGPAEKSGAGLGKGEKPALPRSGKQAFKGRQGRGRERERPVGEIPGRGKKGFRRSGRRKTRGKIAGKRRRTEEKAGGPYIASEKRRRGKQNAEISTPSRPETLRD